MKLKLFVTFIFFSVAVSSASVKDLYNISFLTTDHGLVQNMIDDVYKDSRGFMWFATWSGLERFDGYEFIHYSNKTYLASVKSNFVRAVAEDGWNRLWICTDGGIDVIDLETDIPVHFDLSGLRNKHVFDTRSQMVYIDNYGTVWVNCEKYLAYIIMDRQGNPMNIGLMFNDRRLNDDIVALTEIDGALWAGVNNIVYRIVKTEAGYQYVESPVGEVSETVRKINKIVSVNRTVWIGTDFGLFTYDLTKGQLRRYMHEIGDNRSLSQNYITDITEDRFGNIFVSTLNGLNIFEPETGSFERIVYNGVPDEQNINCNFINCLYYDDEGILWIGTEKGGINKMVRKRVMFHNILYRPDDPWCISVPPVNAIFEDSDGILWVGTVEGGLNHRKGGTDRYDKFVTDFNDPTSLGHNSVSYITEDDKGDLWLGTWGGGINKVINKNGADVRFERFSQVECPDLPSNYISTMVYDRINSGFWIGNPGQLALFRPRDMSFKIIKLGGGWNPFPWFRHCL